jgi:hypothetical protein
VERAAAVRYVGTLVAITGLTCIALLLRRAPHSVRFHANSYRGLVMLPLYTAYGLVLGIFGRRIIDRAQENQAFGWVLLGTLFAIGATFSWWYVERYGVR